METQIISDGKIVEQVESLKLSKMSKGYQWELKIIPKPDSTDEENIARIEKLNTTFMEKFGNLSDSSITI